MIAHASGFSWDEGLLVLTPIVVVTFLLTVARRRVRKQAEAGRGGKTDNPTS